MEQLFTHEAMLAEAALIEEFEWIDLGDMIVAQLVGQFWLSVEIVGEQYEATVCVAEERDLDPEDSDQFVTIFDYQGFSLPYALKQCAHFFMKYYGALKRRVGDCKYHAGQAEQQMEQRGFVTGWQRNLINKVEETLDIEFTGTTWEEAEDWLAEYKPQSEERRER